MSDKEIEDINQNVADLAEAIVKIADLGDALLNSRLKRKTLLILIAHHTKLPQRDVEAVLLALPRLREYLK